jgi:hypothetical protein
VRIVADPTLRGHRPEGAPLAERAAD